MSHFQAKPLVSTNTQSTSVADVPRRCKCHNNTPGGKCEDCKKQQVNPKDDRLPRTTVLRAERGQLTFNAEGTEGGRFHSRKAHVPPGNSGVTIGRGYDIGQHTHAEVVRDLTAAGLKRSDAEHFAKASRLHSKLAKEWLSQHMAELPEISPDQQQRLFESVYSSQFSEVRRISGKYARSKAKEAHSTDVRNFDIDWSNVNPAIQDLLIDLKYRGDYTPETRKLIQPLAIANDLAGLATVFADRALWKNVPFDRFTQRRDFLANAVTEEQGAKSHILRSSNSKNPIQEIPRIVHSVLRSNGRPLEDAIRSDMESCFNADFSGVRIHNGEVAQASAAALDARAYTVGKAIVFGPNEYSPTTSEGRKLIAHELAHVASSPNSESLALPRSAAISMPGDPIERAAEAAATKALAGTVNAPLVSHGTSNTSPMVCRQSRGVECGETGRWSSVDHMLIEQHYKNIVNPNSDFEWGIPKSSITGRKGYVDLVDWNTHGLFEIKPVNEANVAAKEQLMRYRYYAQEYCDPLADWIYGESYPSPQEIQTGDPNSVLVVWLSEPGILAFEKRQQQKQYQPAPMSVSAAERKRNRTPTSHEIGQVLIALGIGALAVVAVAAALADPEPVSKLALLGLSAEVIEELLAILAVDEASAAGSAEATVIASSELGIGA